VNVSFAEPKLPTIDEITHRIDHLFRADSSHAQMRMQIKTDRFSRSLELEQWSKGDQKTLMVIRSPAREAGTATLKTEEGLWNYAPRADRLVRIPSGLLSESWMGSHFTNDDLMQESKYKDDFKTQLSWAEYEGSRHLKMIATPNEGVPVVYTKAVFLLRADS